MTLIELVGLLAIVVGGCFSVASFEMPAVQSSVSEVSSWNIVVGVVGGGVIAFFAFIGFEDLVNMAEETERPEETMPRAIFLTLAISTTLYILVALVAVWNVPIAQLATSEAPLSLVFERTTGLSAVLISAIAIVATLNGVIVQMIMASRVVYGLSRQRSLPSALGDINSLTQTPLVATCLVGALVLGLAMAVPLSGLAQATSQLVLAVFASVNLSLVIIKLRGDVAPQNTVIVQMWVPIAGFVFCCLFLIAAFV